MIMIINNINGVYAITMIICLCNGITDKQIDCAAKEGAGSWRDVHATYGKTPQCGSCQCEMEKRVRSTGQTRSTEALGSVKYSQITMQLMTE